MVRQEGVEKYLNAIVDEGLYGNKDNLRFHMNTLFRGIDFTDKTVLDIGGGSGHHSFYAASRGAKKVICLEPEFEGSSVAMIDEFQKMKERLNYAAARLEPVTLQEFDAGGETFDIILLHNSINHLDESACMNLLDGDEPKAIYKEVFAKMYALSKSKATLIVCDCSRYNFFNRFGIHNPFAPTIEWHKHQAPELWASLLEEVGYVKPRTSWSSFNRLRELGKLLLGNRFMAYFLTSHFCLTMKKP